LCSATVAIPDVRIDGTVSALTIPFAIVDLCVAVI
jgi:hypothetical protein